jgi:glycine/D-amino acid oxidase-like deaminating enzyme
MMHTEGPVSCKYGGIVDLPDSESIRARFPSLIGPMSQWHGIYNEQAGWVPAIEAMAILVKRRRSAGVAFHQGDVTGILKSGNRYTGIVTNDGQAFYGSKVILAGGAWSDELIDLKGQVTAVSYGIVQIQLTDEERKELSSLPILVTLGHGDWFPPNSKGIMKGCNIQVAFTNIGKGNQSIPRDPVSHPTDVLPIDYRRLTRQFLKEFLPPDVANREFLSSKVNALSPLMSSNS